MEIIMARHLYGVDFGTSEIKLYNSANHMLVHEKNVIAVRDGHEILEIGNDAYDMYEKVPDDIRISFPIQNGVIAEIKNMESLFHRFFKKICGKRPNFGSNFCVAIATDITEVEKRAFFDVISNARIHARQIYIVDKPVADAVGVGIDVESPKGNMIVNIGADNTELTVTSLGGIVLSKILKTGGNRMDDNVASLIRRKYNLLIGKKTAELVKIRLADAMGESEKEYRVYGRNVITGLPSHKEISADIVHQAIAEPLENIVDAIKILIERTPPELAADIMDTGIYVTGGSAGIENLQEFLESETGLPVTIAEEPSESVINGIASIIASPKLKHLMYVPREKDY